ncbi:restriction endonuclease subunit S [Lachnospira eligens]|uniref:restriction endonuclease subunit S n=1 Tax=Lachnospira eligens TaxID=39485 RepID=UPI000E50DBD3|nr:restriction endonuclease subunit S [Lachnospira eligens]RHM10853.1 restriction endonuclease subunit S [Lachnospira eligens]
MAEMKDSGTAWLGMIPKDWELSKISSIYELRTQKVSDKDYPPLSVTMNGIVPQLDSAAKTNAHDDRKLVKKGDFAINSRSDRRGSCGVSEYDGSVSLINTVMKPRDEMNPDYYNWLFHTIQFADEFYKWGHGIVDDLWTTNWQDMKHIDIPVPTLDEQKVIADYLNKAIPEIDALHTDIEKQIETLEEYKKSIITEAVTKGLDPDVEMKDSGIELIGQIPNEWKISRLGWISKKIGDGIHGTVTFEDGETNFYFINGNNIKKRNIAIKDNTQRITERIYNTYKTNLTTHTILISLNGTIGNLAFYNNENVLLGKSVGFIELKEEYNREYIYYLLQANYIKTIFELSFAGTTINNLSLQTLRKTNVLLPPKTEQKKIVKYLDKKCAEIDGAIEEKKEQLDTLEQYKKSVIYEYVTGKKEVQ